MKNRQRKKIIKKSFIIVDICSIPNYMDTAEWYFAANKGVLLWDSSLGGQPPFIIPKKNIRAFKVIDKKV